MQYLPLLGDELIARHERPRLPCRVTWTPRGGEASELPLARRERKTGGEQVIASEFGPEDVGDPDLGVGDLPEQEIAHAHLAGGADQEVRVGHPLGGQVGGESSFVDIVRLERAGADILGQASGGVGDLECARRS